MPVCGGSKGKMQMQKGSVRLKEKITEAAVSERQEQLQSRIEKLDRLEAELKVKEKKLKEKEKAKKQVLLRLSPTLWNELASWAEDDFRSINGQIEYLLSEAVRRRKNT